MRHSPRPAAPGGSLGRRTEAAAGAERKRAATDLRIGTRADGAATSRQRGAVIRIRPVQQAVVAAAARRVQKGNSSIAKCSPEHVEAPSARNVLPSSKRLLTFFSSGRRPGRSAHASHTRFSRSGAHPCPVFDNRTPAPPKEKAPAFPPGPSFTTRRLATAAAAITIAAAFTLRTAAGVVRQGRLAAFGALGVDLVGQVLAGFLVDDLHRQLGLAAVVEAQELHLDRLAFGQDVGELGHALVGDLAARGPGRPWRRRSSRRRRSRRPSRPCRCRSRRLPAPRRST